MTESTIQSQFELLRRVVSILQFLLPIDRAQALDTMRCLQRMECTRWCPTKTPVLRKPSETHYKRTAVGFQTSLIRQMDPKDLGLSEIAVFRRWRDPELQEDQRCNEEE